MKLQRKKNAIRNTVWGLISKFITIIAPFLIRTLMIYTLGAEYLGLSSLYISIFQVLNIAELGFSNAIVFNMYKPIAENDHNTVCALMKFYRTVYRYIGCIIFLAGLLILPFLKYVINGSIPSGINIYTLYILYLFNAGISYFLFAYKSSILSAYQREDLISKVYLFIMTIQYTVQILLLFMTKNYYLYYVIVPLVSILNNIIIAVIVSRKYPQYSPIGNLDPLILKDIKQKVVGLVISKLCGVSRNTMDNIIISGFFGLTAVAIYGNYYYILSNIAGILTVLVIAIKAGIGNSIVTENITKNYDDFKTFTFAYAWITGWCTVCLLSLYQPFMKIWVGESYMFPNSIVILFCIYFWEITLADITNAYSGATGLWWENRYRTLGETISNLILNFIFGYYFGVAGIIIATLISIIIFNFSMQVIILFKYYFVTYSAKEYFIKAIRYSLSNVVACMLTYWICTFVSAPGIVGIILKFAVCLVVPNVLYFIFYRKTAEFQSANIMIRKLIKKE